MIARIAFGTKTVHLGVSSVAEAGWAGFKFARDNADLVRDGWRIHYWLPTDHLVADYSPRSLFSSGDIPELIHQGPPCTHTCKDHTPVTK